MRRSIITVSAVVAALTFSACSSSTTPTSGSASPPATVAAPTTAMSQPSTPQAKDIVDTAVAAGQFTTLATALTKAGLIDTLKGPGPFTVFAPTDAAFAKLPAGTLDALLMDPMGKLASILTYHVVPGKVMAADVLKLNGSKVKTVNGAELTVRVSGADVMLVDATGATVKVTKADIMASNGVIHVIDGVLLPSK